MTAGASFFRVYFKTLWILVAPLLLCPLLFFGTAARCCYCILLMSCYWVMEVVPLAVTAFLPLVVLPILGVVPIKRVASAYLSDTNMMFVTSLMLSLAVEECQLHKRIALKMLKRFGTKPQWFVLQILRKDIVLFRLMAGFMTITSFM